MPVKIVRDMGNEVEILAGLADNERVINNPRDGLLDGSKGRATEMLAHGDKKGAPQPTVPQAQTKSIH